jgi:hypothetical protein
MLEMVMKEFENKPKEILPILLRKREQELEMGKKTNMIGSGRIHDLELEIEAIKKVMKKH